MTKDAIHLKLPLMLDLYRPNSFGDNIDLVTHGLHDWEFKRDIVQGSRIQLDKKMNLENMF